MPKLTESELAATTEAVAELLPDEWTYQPAPDRNWGQIAGPNGATLYLTNGLNRPTGAVTGILPDAPFYVTRREHTQCSIGVTLTRPPEAIAREINRRLLPEYLPLYERLRAAVDRHERRQQLQSSLARRLERTAPADPVMSMRVEEHDPEHVRISARLTEAQVLAVFGVLTQSQ